MRQLVIAAVSLLAGLGLGRLAFHSEPVVQNVVTHVPSAREEGVQGAPRGEVVRAERAPAPAASPTPAPGPSDVKGASPDLAATAETEALRARVAQLEAYLESELKVRRQTEGEPIPVPAGVPDRLRDEKQLVSTFNAAFREAGFPGQVSNIDCSEHPCIVFGTGFGQRGDMEKLTNTKAFEAYAKDSMSTFGFDRGQDHQPAHRFFGVAVMPPTKGPPPDDVSKRIAFRVRQMEEVSRP